MAVRACMRLYMGICALNIIIICVSDARTSRYRTHNKEKQLIRSCAVCSFIKLKLTLVSLAIVNKVFSLYMLYLICTNELTSPFAFFYSEFLILFCSLLLRVVDQIKSISCLPVVEHSEMSIVVSTQKII